MSYQDHLDASIEAVYEGAEVLAGASRNKEIAGRDGFGVLKAKVEVESEERIIETIKKFGVGEFRHCSVLAEESGHHESPSKGIWYIDPLDGTYNWLEDRDEWAIIVAYAEDGETKTGAIYLPKKDIIITSTVDDGVRINDERISAPESKPLNDSVVFYDTCYDIFTKDPKEDMLKYQGSVREVIKNRCSADAFYKMLKGDTQLLLEYYATPWDDAFGVLALRELGGVATDRSGNPWVPEKSNTILASTDANLHKEFLELLI